MQLDDIALTMVPSLGVKGVVHLLEVYGSAGAVFAASYDSLTEQAQLRPDVARALLSRDSFRAAEREAAYCRRHDIIPVASTDDEYPVLLREVPDYPHVLYVRGNVAALSMRTVTFVGTRKMTSYGEQVCIDFIRALGGCVPDVCIVSGLAYGIDSAAHRAALYAGVPTVAVVANALPAVTPVSHTALAREIIEKGGAIISELHSQTKQTGSYFISRNRILAALSCGTVSVESAAGGGSLATARLADGYNRPVMAVPGRVTERASQGTNTLIRNRKASAVLSADDIVKELMWDFNLPAERGVALFEDLGPDTLTPAERLVVSLFRPSEVVSSDTLAERSGMVADELSATLMSLEMAGKIRMLAGDKYELTEHF